MLEFLSGVDPSAKREYVGRRLAETVNAGGSAVLIVPEQENFERDKELMLRWGERVSNAVTITSFSHFCRSHLESHLLAVKPRADETAVNVLMSLAVRQVQGELEIYGSHYRRPGRVRELAAFYNALSNAGFGPADLLNAGEHTGDSLRRKTAELAAVYTAFEGLLSKRFSTQTDNINVCASSLRETRDYLETDFWFDDFRGFTGAQIRLIAALLPRCRNVYISLQGFTEGSGSVWFPHAQKNRTRLIEAANRAGVEVRSRVIESLPKTKGLDHLRRNLYAPAPEKLDEDISDIRVLAAPNRYEECELIALEARKLLDEGFCRARDIAVLHRDEGLNAPLLAALKRYGVPVFEDERRPLFSYPLTRLILAAVELAAKGFTTEKVLSALKTELTGVTLEQASALQNYVYIWQIDGRRWESDFTADPRGFGEEARPEAAQALKAINEVRSGFVRPVLKLREALLKKNAEESCRAVYLYLKEINAAEAFQRYAEYLFDRGEEAAAIECGGVWDACMEHLNALRGALGDAPVSPEAFFELLSLIFSGGSVGAIPPGIDKMTVGSVDRTRILSPRVVFIPGFTEGAFPKNTAVSGLLSGKELRALSERSLSLERLPEEVFEEERLILYNALNLPAERLYLSYPAVLTSGEKTTPSPVLEELESIFPRLKKLNGAALPLSEKIRTPETAFSALAACGGEQSVLSASVRSLLSEYPSFGPRISALTRALNGADSSFLHPEHALRLFGKELEMSASKTETYAQCPFSYYCRYGLGVEKLETARLDQRMYGNIIHKALETIVESHLGEGLSELPDELLSAEAEKAVEAYIETSLGGAAALPPHILRALERLKREIYDILRLRRAEAAVSAFRVAKTEFSIGGKNGIPAYEVPLPGGGKLLIRGSVDRVDLMPAGNKSYVRVVDYKTGGKEFELGNVFFGVNMQMLIYLFAICENGAPVFGKTVPAGVLYVPAKNAGKPLERAAGEEEIEARRKENGRMNGVLLENEDVLRGMEKDAQGLFINARINEKGELEGNFLTLNEFGLLHKTVDNVLRDMGADIQKGVIPALPLQSGAKLACTYCSYKPVCLKEQNAERRIAEKMKHALAVQKLYEEADR